MVGPLAVPVPMKKFTESIEQLALAGKQLAEQSTFNSRFALIVVDNFVELLLHRKCRETLYEHRKYGEPALSAKDVAAVIGQKFDLKAKLCANFKLIADEERDFILTCHEYRNEAYHVGRGYNDIAWDLTSRYHDLACDLFQRHPQRVFVHSFDAVSTVAAQFVGDDVGSFVDHDEIPRIADKLKSTKPERSKSLGSVLSKSAIDRINRIEETLSFVRNETNGFDDERRLIEEIQFHAYVWRDDFGCSATFEDGLSAAEIQRRVADIRSQWKPAFFGNPVDRWTGRAKELSNVGDYMATQKFHKLKAEMTEFSVGLNFVADQIDEQIQREIDVGRGN